MSPESSMPLVGIFASGRNGSSLLMRLLDSSPDLWVHPVETSYVSAFHDLATVGRVRPRTAANAVKHRPLQLDRAVAAEQLTALFRPHLSQIRAEFVEKLVEPIRERGNALEVFAGRPPIRAERFLPELFGAIRDAFDQRPPRPALRCAFKSIETPYIADYLKLFPEMRCIHIVRHPLQVYASTKRGQATIQHRPFWYLGGDTLRTVLEYRWLPHAQFLAAHWTPGSRAHYVVTYEALVRDPQHTIRALCQWLGIAPPADPAKQTVLGGREVNELPVNTSKLGVKTPIRVQADLAPERGYEDVVTPREAAFILERTRPYLSLFGYPAPQPLSWSRRTALAGAWLLPDRWERMHASSRLRLGAALTLRRGYIWSALLAHRRAAAQVGHAPQQRIEATA